ncbi:MAG: type I DNA topoisomerase, partial [Bacteroidetes bacterium]|nr:type I DNA topoisomerase [Bacteroidota bacterium]
MPKHLLIVESPAKAKTIEKYLGKDYRVEASMGHIRDLPKGNNAIDVANNFAPKYVVSKEKNDVVKKLRDLAKDAESVWLATDEDREGEAISWHLVEVLGLDLASTRRIVFHEITKNAIQQAIQKPRTVDMNLVNAQQARRVLDRLVGFELSPLLWKKLKPGLSAGRVQSVAVRLIVEREREIIEFAAQTYYRITAQLQGKVGKPFQAELKARPGAHADALSILQICQNARFQVADVQKKPGKRSPAPPFTTSTLQQEASRKLGMSVTQTMRIAQSLYENGYITYMRTDSLNLSETALKASQEAIIAQFGARYHQRRTYKTKSAGAQEAHEAIRPTDFTAQHISGLENQEQRLYELIWKRAVASQMADAELEKTTISIDILGEKPLPQLVATGEVITFDGFMKLYLESREEDEDDEENAGLLPALQKGDPLHLLEMLARESFTRPPARYNEAALVKKLEELGIGRPSTYAPTISTIQKREYVIRESREGVRRKYQELLLKDGQISPQTRSENVGVEKNKLFPTDLGVLVTDFLVNYFPNVIDYSFTASVEEEFDIIANGKLHWEEMLRRFYGPFHERVQLTESSAERATGEKELGADPASGKPVIVRMGRYGPLAQIGLSDDPDKRFASLQKNQRIETLTLEQALDLFKLPRHVGEYEDAVVKAAVGRFGPYLQHKSKFYSLPKDLGPLEVSLEEAITLIEAKRKADAERVIHDFGEQGIQVLNGRFGPYIT